MGTKGITALAVLLVAAASLTLAACGSSDNSSSATATEAQVQEEAESNCDPNYSGACLDAYASDYDCEGGSGNGPYYTGEVSVVGEDHYGLDADGDGVGCEPY